MSQAAGAEKVLLGRAAEPEDIEIYCDPNEPDGECVIRYREELEETLEERVGPLLAAVRRCNGYEASEYVPVVVHDNTPIGWINRKTYDALAPQLASGTVCELVELCLPDILAKDKSGERCGPCVRLAPGAASAKEASDMVAAMVSELVSPTLIPQEKLRNELQDVHPLELGFVPPSAKIEPVFRLERAAMIYFGVPSYGVHVNGWVRDPDNPTSSRPHAMWVARRSLTKATYAGKLDQVVAGGQPSYMDFDENVRKECEEEASLPAEVIRDIEQAGAISYRYSTPKGLSTKTLVTYDLEFPSGLRPVCADGEVEEFSLVPVGELLRSLREDLPLWKPNSAMVAIDFCIRHGLVGADEPGYAEMVSLLHPGDAVLEAARAEVRAG